VNQDDIVRDYGADTLRTYEMFIGAFDLSASWSEDGVKGCRRFLERVWKLQDMVTEEDAYLGELETKMHQTIKKVSNDFEAMKFNTAIAQMMTMVNEFYRVGKVTKKELSTLLLLLNPVAPHMTEEMWEIIGGEGHIYQNTWPEYEEAKTVENEVEIAVQINGKIKTTIKVAKDIAKEDALALGKEALTHPVTVTESGSTEYHRGNVGDHRRRG
uniref:class I tRNA ligase family protein n=1 Tax=Candidatus Methanarcanum hacksteinii TaxID=2911857 RepID=UPI0037DDB60B